MAMIGIGMLYHFPCLYGNTIWIVQTCKWNTDICVIYFIYIPDKNGVVVGAQAWLAGYAPVSEVSTWKGEPRWIPSAWFHFHSSQTWYSGLVYWESFSWLTSVGTTRNTFIRLGWSRIGLAVPIVHAAGAGLIGMPAVISGRYNKCHSQQLQ